MNGRGVVIVVGIAFVLATAIRTNGEENHGNASDQPQAVQDTVVNFGVPQPQAPPVNLLVPDEVTIVREGTVTFRVNGGGHGIAIYPVSKNTTRDDITNQLCIHDVVGGQGEQ